MQRLPPVHPAGLVVLKAVASQDDVRRRTRDFIDLAQLALRDREGFARAALSTLIPRLQNSAQARKEVRAMRRVRAAFAGEDSEGTIIASRALLAGVSLP